MNPFISLCMIVKNEQSVIRRCLDSVYGIVDEIVVVDTGSSDNTKELVHNYTNKVYDYKWNNDFSDARNFAASKAKGEWILVLDADEYVYKQQLEETINFLKLNKNIFDVYAVNIVNFVGDNGENALQHKHVRIYRNNNTIEFHRSVHEQLRYINKDQDLKIGIIPSLVIYHSGYLNKVVNEKNKNERNKILIEKELEKSNSGFDLYNLANELITQGRIEDALNTYVLAFQRKTNLFDDWVPRCTVSIIECLIALEKFDDAKNVIKDARPIYSDSPDFIFLEGLVEMYTYNLVEAKKHFYQVLNENERLTNIIKSPDYSNFHPFMKLGMICELEKDFHGAIKNYCSALNYNKFSSESISRILIILSNSHSIDEIYNFLDNIYSHKLNEQNRGFLVKCTMNIGMTELASLLLDGNK